MEAYEAYRFVDIVIVVSRFDGIRLTACAAGLVLLTSDCAVGIIKILGIAEQ